MNRTRVVLLGILAVLVAVWVSSASLPSAPAETPATQAAARAAARAPAGDHSRDSVQAAPLLFNVNDVAERLRTRRQEGPKPRIEGRNPFEYAPRAPAPRPVTAAPPPAPAEPATPPPPAFTLSGIVDKTEGEKQVRTAVISGYGQLFFARAGDTIATRYQITTITPDVVELRDIYTQQITRLALR